MKDEEPEQDDGLTVWGTPLHTPSDFQTSPTTEKLDAALAKAQGEMKNAVKSKENPFFKSKYADLADVWDACRQALAKHNLNITQWPVASTDEQLHLVTRIGCEGEWMLSRSSVPVPKQDPQGYGSALSYLRRYALSALLGIATEDDDGASATESGKAPKPAAKKAAKEEPKEMDGRSEWEADLLALPAKLNLTAEKAVEVLRDVLGHTDMTKATDDQLDLFEASLRGQAEAIAAAFGTEARKP